MPQISLGASYSRDQLELERCSLIYELIKKPGEKAEVQATTILDEGVTCSWDFKWLSANKLPLPLSQ